MKGKSIQLSLLVVAIALASSGCKRLANDEKPEQKAASHIERAEAYRQQGQYRAAIIEARNAIDAAPESIRGAVELASLYNELNQGKLALQALDKIGDSNDRAVVIARADALLAQGKFRSALEHLQAHRSEDAEIRLRIAQAQAGLEQTAEAEATFVALENTALATTAKLQLARLYMQQGNSDGASKILQQILQTNPDSVDALILSAKLAEMQGNLESTEALLSRALIGLPQTDIVSPQKMAVLQQLIPVLTKLGRSSESLVYAKVLADADPQGAILQDKFKKGVEAFKAGNLDEAESLLDEVYQQTHNDYAGIMLGMVKYSKKDYSGAAAYLGENIDPEVTSDTALKALANAEMRLGQPGKLLELIGPDERKHIADPELKALLGIALVQSGDQTGGEKMLLDALRSKPENAAVRATLARHYLISHQIEKAIATLEESGTAKNDLGLQRLLIGAYIAAGKSDAALQAARKLAATTPEQAANYYVLGHTALMAQQYSSSESALQKTLALNPNFTPALLDLAQLRLLRHEPQAAADIYQRLMTANPDNGTAIKGFITTQEMLATKPDATEIEKRVLQLADSTTARAVMAEHYLRTQRRDDANRILSAMQIEPGNNYAAFVKRLYAFSEASELLRAKDYSRARQTVLDGLRLEPRDANLLALLARIEIAAGDTQEAKRIIEQLAAAQPGSPILADLQASIALAAGDAAGATQQLRTFWNNTKTDEAANNLYQALAKTDPAAAMQFLTEWQSALPNSDRPLLLLAIQHELNGETQQAQKYYEATLNRNDSNALALNNLAMLYFSKGDSRAAATAEKAYALQPQNPAVLDTYGWILVNTKDRKKGLELLQQAAAIDPTSAEIAQHLKHANQAH